MTLGLVVVAYAIMISFMKRPPGAEVIIVMVTVPRLHDIGWSGWWMLLFIGGEILAILLGLQLGGAEGIMIAGGLFVLVTLLVLIVIALIPGEPVPNRWGNPPPRGISFKSPKAS